MRVHPRFHVFAVRGASGEPRNKGPVTGRAKWPLFSVSTEHRRLGERHIRQTTRESCLVSRRAEGRPFPATDFTDSHRLREAGDTTLTRHGARATSHPLCAKQTQFRRSWAGNEGGQVRTNPNKANSPQGVGVEFDRQPRINADSVTPAKAGVQNPIDACWIRSQRGNDSRCRAARPFEGRCLGCARHDEPGHGRRIMALCAKQTQFIPKGVDARYEKRANQAGKESMDRTGPARVRSSPIWFGIPST
jgi:hypothetical protein